MPCVKDDPARAAQREYMRRWRANNPDKVKASQERFWLKKAAEIRSQEQTAAGSPGRQTDGE